METRLLGFYNWVISPIPFFWRFKNIFLKWCGVEVGRAVSIQPGVKICGCGKLILEDNVILRSGVYIECSGGNIRIGHDSEVNYGTILSANANSNIIVGANVRIAHMCSLKCTTHEIDCASETRIAGCSVYRDIKIGDGSWLCAGCIILPGVNVGLRNIIAAGAVVIADTNDNVLMCGVPAVVKKKYLSNNENS